MLVLTEVIEWPLRINIYQEVEKRREKSKYKVDNLRLPNL